MDSKKAMHNGGDVSPENCDLNFHGQCIVDNQDCTRATGQSAQDCFTSRVKRRDHMHATPVPADTLPAPAGEAPIREPRSLRGEINARRAMLGLPPIP